MATMAHPQCPNPECGSPAIATTHGRAYLPKDHRFIHRLIFARAFWKTLGALMLLALALAIASSLVEGVSVLPQAGAWAVVGIGLVFWWCSSSYLRSLDGYRISNYRCKQCGYRWSESHATFEQMVQSAQWGLEARRAIWDKRFTYHVLATLGVVALYQGDHERAQRYSEESAGLAWQLADWRARAHALNHLGVATLFRGDVERAEASIGESLVAFRTFRDWFGLACALDSQGLVALQRGLLESAGSLVEESLRAKRKMGYALGIAWSLANLAAVAAASGQPERAVRLAGAATRLFAKLEWPMPKALRQRQEGVLAEARAALGAPACEHAWREGYDLEMDPAVAYGLGEG